MAKETLQLTQLQKDALQELGNVCAGNAATALSQMLNRRIGMSVPQVSIVPITDVPEVVGGTDTMVTAVVLHVLGDAPGVILLLFPQKAALTLANLLTNKGKTNGVMTEMEQSAIKEIGTILVSAYLNAMSTFTGFGLVPSTPGLVIDMAGALIDYILIELTLVSDYALVIESEFREETTSAKGHFFLLPTPGSLDAILKMLGANN